MRALLGMFDECPAQHRSCQPMRWSGVRPDKHSHVVITSCGNGQATANPVVRGVVVTGANVLPQREIEEAFGAQFGRTLNFPAFSASLRRLNRWYEDRGIFGQVCGPGLPSMPPLPHSFKTPLTGTDDTHTCLLPNLWPPFPCHRR